MNAYSTHARGSDPSQSAIKCFPRIFVDLTKVPQVFRNPGGSPALQNYKTTGAFVAMSGR
jgi:hypothetical protein